MLTLTKIFQIEMAHDINRYSGICKNIHNHIYELHATLSTATTDADNIPAPGFLPDFKKIKKPVT